MRRCRGINTSGVRCHKLAVAESAYCHVHRHQAVKSDHRLEALLAGGAAGALVGGIPGVFFGALSGLVAGDQLRKEIMSKTRAFISFDYENDSDLKTLLVGQSKHEDSPFEIADWSVKEHLTGDWKEKVRAKLRRVDQMIVICGEKTDTATGVSAEVRLAQEEQVPYFLLNGRAQTICKMPNAAKSSDKLYKWSWDNLKSLIGGGR